MCNNPEVSVKMLSLLESKSSNFGELVVTPQVAKTRKWRAIGTYFRMQLRCGIDTSFVMDMAHTEGSTAVHYGESTRESTRELT